MADAQTTTRQCTQCGSEQSLERFYFDASKQYRYRECKSCVASRRRAAREADPEKYNSWHRAYRAQNRERLTAQTRAWRQARPEKSREYTKRWRRKDPAKAMFIAAKHRARLLGIEFSIAVSDISIPAICPVLGIPFGPNTGRGPGAFSDSASLDRIDPSKGYIPGNIQVLSRRANTMKSNATATELLAFAEWIRKKFA